nr:MAG TPA: hypothetical protein [Caudoviricetes sp.]
MVKNGIFLAKNRLKLVKNNTFFYSYFIRVWLFY